MSPHGPESDGAEAFRPKHPGIFSLTLGRSAAVCIGVGFVSVLPGLFAATLTFLSGVALATGALCLSLRVYEAKAVRVAE